MSNWIVIIFVRCNFHQDTDWRFCFQTYTKNRSSVKLSFYVVIPFADACIIFKEIQYYDALVAYIQCRCINITVSRCTVLQLLIFQSQASWSIASFDFFTQPLNDAKQYADFRHLNVRYPSIKCRSKFPSATCFFLKQRLCLYI